MEFVWFDFGSGAVEHREKTVKEMNAFIAGVEFACAQNEIEDYRQFNSLVEVERAATDDR